MYIIIKKILYNKNKKIYNIHYQEFENFGLDGIDKCINNINPEKIKRILNGNWYTYIENNYINIKSLYNIYIPKYAMVYLKEYNIVSTTIKMLNRAPWYICNKKLLTKNVLKYFINMNTDNFRCCLECYIEKVYPFYNTFKNNIRHFYIKSNSINKRSDNLHNFIDVFRYPPLPFD